MKALLDLVNRWRSDADLLRDHGASEAATTTEKHAGELVEAVRQVEDEELTLAEAAAVSGYARRTIRQKVSTGEIPNMGATGRPRVRRGDLPVKVKSKKGSDFDAASEARQILDGIGEPA